MFKFKKHIMDNVKLRHNNKIFTTIADLVILGFISMWLNMIHDMVVQYGIGFCTIFTMVLSFVGISYSLILMLLEMFLAQNTEVDKES